MNELNSYKERIISNLYNSLYENYKGLTKNPQWLLMRKISRFRFGRAIISCLSQRSNLPSSTLTLTDSYFIDVNVDEVVNQLKSEGVVLGINLPQHVVKEIVKFAESTVCYGNRKPELGFYYHQKEQAQAQSQKKFVVANYFNTALHCPAINKLQSDPVLLAIAAKYLQQKPVHQGSLLWWSFPGERTYQQLSSNGQLFHYDLDDYRFLKFFFYLTDVDEESGPHLCVRGSHNRKKLSHLIFRKRETDEDIIKYYGLESLVTVYGKAGFGFVEDGFCFHKGVPPTHKNRLILQIEFATTDYGMQNDIREPSLLKCM
jgi:hypothetical protein